MRHLHGVAFRTEVALDISERDFQDQVCELLDLFGWRWTHFRPALTAQGYRTPLSGAKGFPDLIAVRGTRLLAIELKSERGKTTDDQTAWLDAFSAVPGVEAYVVYPSGLERLVEKLRP